MTFTPGLALFVFGLVTGIFVSHWLFLIALIPLIVEVASWYKKG